MEYLIVKYVHLIGVLGVTGTLVAEFALIRKELSIDEMKKLARIDSFYGLFAIVALIGGFILWFGVGKPAEFYSEGIWIYVKLILFTIIGVLSIFPTIFFLKNRKPNPEREQTGIQLPMYIILIVRIEVALLVFIPLFAVLMAAGVRI